ncbi:hypothetical protein OAS19_03595, partial [Altererythrobacter sp.]|nr:hypothetical protein [Altererythrobacter sp.]
MAQRDKRKAGTKAPISAHPVFPAIVALWFAALFGIGCLVLPTALVEKIVVGAGLPAIVDAAAPPIGFTARMIMGVAAALLGAAAGLFVARKVAAAQTAPVSPRRAPKPAVTEDAAKRPIFATEELGEEGLGPVRDDWEDYSDTHDSEPDDAFDHEVGAEPPLNDSPPKSRQPMPGRRRSLSVTDEGGRSDFLASVPLPGQADIDLDDELSLEGHASEEGAAEPEAAEYAESVQIFANPATAPAPAETVPELPPAAPFPADIGAQPLDFSAPAAAAPTPTVPAVDTAETAAVPAANPITPKEADM